MERKDGTDGQGQEKPNFWKRKKGKKMREGLKNRKTVREVFA